jgi:tyrosine-protein kinase Etk/Wzc
LDEAKPQDAIQISPKPSRNKMTAIIIALMIPLSIIVLTEFLNDKIVEPKDVEKSTRVPIYGSIGHNDEVSDIPVAENPKSAIAESFRALRTNLQYVLRSGQEKIICISSTISGEGKTFSAVNLASIIAQSNKKTLLLSLDLRKPKIHKIFNMENDKGLSTYLIGRTSFEDSIHPTNINNLFVATAGPVPPNPAELLETPLMDTFIANARRDFDVIIMDTPPLAVVTDAYILTRFSNVFLFVVRQNYSSKSVLQLVDELHHKRGIQNVGIIINDVKVSNYYGRKYGYSSYGYNYSYGDGYYGDTEKKSFKDRLIKFLFRS